MLSYKKSISKRNILWCTEVLIGKLKLFIVPSIISRLISGSKVADSDFLLLILYNFKLIAIKKLLDHLIKLIVNKGQWDRLSKWQFRCPSKIRIKIPCSHIRLKRIPFRYDIAYGWWLLRLRLCLFMINIHKIVRAFGHRVENFLLRLFLTRKTILEWTFFLLHLSIMFLYRLGFHYFL